MSEEEKLNNPEESEEESPPSSDSLPVPEDENAVLQDQEAQEESLIDGEEEEDEEFDLEAQIEEFRLQIEEDPENCVHHYNLGEALSELGDEDEALNEFDLALSSHFLFLYSDHLSFDFHLASIKEMLRVSRETRIFPLLDVNGNKSTYFDKVVSELNQYKVTVKKVNYEFQIGGNEVLIILKT